MNAKFKMVHLKFSEIEHFDSRFEFNSSQNDCKNLYFRLSCKFFPLYLQILKNIYIRLKGLNKELRTTIFTFRILLEHRHLVDVILRRRNIHIHSKVQ